MQYINHKTNTLYSGDRAHWRDTPVSSERPSPYHVPVVEDGEHTGWEVSADGLSRAYDDALERIKQAHADALANTRDRYSAVEREGWHELIADAKDGGGDCIEGYAEDLGISVSEAVNRVFSARDGYRKAYGNATGKLARLRDEADALYEAGDIDGLEAMAWD